MKKSRLRRARRRGFTLMEVLLVMAILVILGSMVGFGVIKMKRNADEDAARVQISLFEQLLTAYRLDVGSYPNSNQGLQALILQPSDLPNPAKWRGPYTDKQIPMDPWGQPYQYELLNADQFRIFSFGADMVNGSEDDISNIVQQQ
jgi:general secretion pathway protein G